MTDKQIKILIAEDDPFLSKIIGNRLREEGFSVDIASDGEEALNMLIKDKYDLLMLDLIMPVKTGFEVLQEIRVKKIQTPVLVFTNLAQTEDKKEVTSLGAKGYYVKSDIAMNDLVLTVKKFINVV